MNLVEPRVTDSESRSMTDVVEVNDLTTLRAYHLAWTALHGETPGASFFQTFEWFETYWQHYGAGKRMRVLVVRSENRPIGIVPLVEQTELTTVGPVRVLTYPLDSWGSWYGPIGACPAAVLALAMRHLVDGPKTWEVLRPRWIARETADRGRTETAMRVAGMRPWIEQEATTSVIELGGFADWDDYLASRSSKVRHEIRRQRRRLEQTYQVDYTRYRTESVGSGGGDPRWDLYEQCVAVAERSWQSSSKSGNTITHSGVADFMQDIHESAARIGMVDMSLLYLDEQPVAYLYNLCCHGEVTGLRMGYDRELPVGAGSVLLGYMIEDSLSRGDVRIDLGAGGEPYKKRLATTTASSSRLTYVAPRAIRPRALQAARWCLNRFRKAS